MKSGNNQLLEALKIAFCYMPEDIFLTTKEYSKGLPKIKSEVEFVRDALKSEGIDPDKLYEELNPKLSKS